MLNEFWQTEIGDFTFDQSRFASIKETTDIIHRRGFRIILTIQPFIGTESVNFAEAVEKHLLVGEMLLICGINDDNSYKTIIRIDQ